MEFSYVCGAYIAKVVKEYGCIDIDSYICYNWQMTKKLIFIDDSGDPGFKGVSSRYFLMSAAVFDNVDLVSEVDKLISDFRSSLGWNENAEFKFRKTNKIIIKQLLRLITDFDFEIYCVYIDKTKYATLMSLIDKGKLYNWMIKRLIETISFNEARIMMDGAADKKTRLSMASYIRREINGIDRRVKNFKLVDSRRDNLIQLADLISGFIGRSFKTNKTDANDYIKIIRNKIVGLQEIDLNV